MTNDDVVEEKICGACLQKLSYESFSKKQWQQKQRRRCKQCAGSGKEIDVAKLVKALCLSEPSSNASNNGNSTTKKKKGRKKDKPVFAGDAEGRYQTNSMATLAYDICAWCGKTEENESLLRCPDCKNIFYCSKVCQKAAWPEHKLTCEALKQEYKETKNRRKAQKKSGDYSISEASGTGSFFLDYLPDIFSSLIYRGELRNNEQPGQFFATDAAEEGVKRKLGPEKFLFFSQKMREESLKSTGELQRIEFFTDVNELNAFDQFLLSCGPFDDIQRAKDALPYVLHGIHTSGLKPDGSIPNIGDITVRGYNLNALEWASRRGNFAIAEWLATDSRTKVMLTRPDSAPVAWACYTNRVELARMLVKHGADSRATTPVVFGHKPPSHLAGENGQLLALKYLIEECGHDIHECDTEGQDIRVSLRRNNRVWAQSQGCIAVDDYAKSKGVLGEMSTTNRKAKAAAKNKTESSTNNQLAAALRQLEIAGGTEDDSDDDEAEDVTDPGDYLDELLSVADARYNLGQYSKAANLYYKGYHAAMHRGSCINAPAIFPIAHKMIQACTKTGEKSDLNMAHGMAQQNAMMPGHPAYIREDLAEVERIMTKKGMRVERFAMGMGGLW